MACVMRRLGPALLGLLLACGTETPDPTEIAAGVWAGREARATVDASGALFAFRCAAGSALPPLTVDSSHRFDLPGSYEVQAGPEPYRREPARFRGEVRGQAMTLEVRLGDGSLAWGPGELILGGPDPQLIRCR